MIGTITPELRDRILARIDLLEVIGTRLSLRPAGQLHKACCPFHQEKTPSFTVTPERQTYHCFGCGAHGNAIDFLMEYERLSYPEAIAELAQQAGIELPQAHNPAAGIDTGPILHVLEQAAALYQQQLREAPQAQAYLRQRGLSEAIAGEFGLGFAPPGWDFLLKRLGADPTQRQTLIDAGLVVERDKEGEIRRYDRFRQRLMFPIRDQRGRVIAFGGRVLDQSEPKYLNSPETPVFHKGRELYGLYEARQHQRRIERLLIVEGYLDVIALAQFHLPIAVATLGTSTTPEQLQRLKRQADELVFCFDGDRAGREAAWKALKISLPFAVEPLLIRFLLLPPGDDPDSLLREQGQAAFEARLDEALLLSDFLFAQLQEQADLNSAEGRSRIDARARKLIAQVPPGTFRQLLLQRLESLVGVQGASMAGRRRADRRGQALTGAWTSARPHLTAPRLAMALLLRCPQLALVAREITDQWTQINDPDIALLAELLAHADADPDISPDELRAFSQGTEQEATVQELSNSELIQHIPQAGVEPEFAGALHALARQAEREQRYRLLSRGSPGQLSNEQKALLRQSQLPADRHR